ncbi:MAG: L,D-transpeptidase [Gammaproteobacteria bacterium]|nr:L,D-transpeptidase [Gammaproteobacteria bacterium]
MVEPHILIEIEPQRLTLWQGGISKRTFSVSTSAQGVGQQQGCGGTPLGRFTIRACIGGGMREGSVFIGRRATGEIYSPQLARAYPQRDWILSRILWLTGSESGKNRGGAVDTLRRFIYIHGTADEEPMGIPLSHGCIRMRNRDVIALFAEVGVGTGVEIVMAAGERCH